MILAQTAAARARSQDVDLYVGARVRDRRILVGMAQHQLADLIGVTYQQEHKYEKGINRISAGRLYEIARSLGVEVGYFYEGLLRTGGPPLPRNRRMLLELARNFMNIRNQVHQEAVVSLARALAERENGDAPAAVSPDRRRARWMEPRGQRG